MITLMEKNQIILDYKNGLSMRAIAKKLGIARRTVKRYVEIYINDQKSIDDCNDLSEQKLLQEKMLSKSKMDTSNRKATIFTGELEERFNQLLAQDEQRNKELGINKQSINSGVLYRTLIREGFNVGESTVRLYYHRYKDKHKEAFIRQQYDFGEVIDFDFHEIKLIINGEKRNYHQVTITAPASNYVYVHLYHDETFATVARGLMDFFKYCNGVFKEVVFDNLSPVVIHEGWGKPKRYTEDITKFATYYGFKITTTNARKGNEKGSVEVGGKHARSELFSLNYKFNNEDELNEYIENSLKLINRDSYTKFSKEKEMLRSLPLHDYIIGEIGISKVNSYSCICYEKNFYSVPDCFVGKELRYSVFNTDIVIYDDNKEVARHKLKDGVNQYSLDIYHYLETLKHKPGALNRSLALKQADKDLIAIYTQNYKDNPKQFIELLSKNNLVIKENNTIENASISQLDQINQIYNLGGNC